MSTALGDLKVNKLAFLRLMMQSREGDRREGILLRQSKGWFQVSGMGHEALGYLASFLREDDWLFPYYRDRALMLARGLSNYDLALTYFAKQASTGAGRQMPGHYCSRKHNVMSVCTVTAGGLIPATGTAWGMKMDGKDSLVLATVGDAAVRQGEFYEALAFAVQEKLSVIFAIEDNKFGISTPTQKFMPLHFGGVIDPTHVVKVDGRRLETIHESMSDAVAKARNGSGPTVLWFDIDRLSSHTSSDDHRVYRPQADIDAMLLRDPITLLRDELIADGELTLSDFEAHQAEIAKAVDEDYQRAEKEADPVAGTLFANCWGESTTPEPPSLELAPTTMVEAINRTFKKALSDDPRYIFFGEDIEDPKGGVFGITKGLSSAFPKQVFNAPLAEATIMGTAVGLSAYGFKPVFELQFVDFFTPAFNQILTNVSSTRWRSNGEWSTPFVVYAPYGAYLPGGSLWHSQSNEGFFAHVPGIKLAVPSTPEDAAGLFWTALHDDDPCFIFVPKHVFRKRVDVKAAPAVPFGSARIVSLGKDVTVVAWGNTVELVVDAISSMEDGDRIEVIDLRSIVPCDYETIVKSLEKTGRLVVVQEDTRTCGFGQAVISEIVGDPDRFALLYSSPQLVSRGDVHIGYNPIYEYAALPSIEDVVAAIKRTLA